MWYHVTTYDYYIFNHYSINTKDWKALQISVRTYIFLIKTNQKRTTPQIIAQPVSLQFDAKISLPMAPSLEQ